ncbi:hypothetical protein [Actinomyces wuliandei]|uniref:hypothetical protein n=1 Tax=Actinomyces wuliandei TaxID=2057743 RepID=UPI000FD77043|nr:hypothetical protein [Actinomyces wuliandei]
MPLRRPFAVASATAALVGASLLAVPAGAASDFSAKGEAVIDPSTTSYTVSGSGCTGQDATVSVALLPPGSQDLSSAVTATPAADGTWSTTLDVASLVSASGGDVDEDGWTVSSACVAYNETTSTARYGVFLDSTTVTGTFHIKGGVGSQVLTIKASGFTPGETIEVYLESLDTGARAASLGSLTAADDGSVNGSLAAPSDVADGIYRLALSGSRYGEYATSRKLIQVSDGTYSVVSDGEDGTDSDAVGTGDPAAEDPDQGTAATELTAEGQQAEDRSASGTGSTVSVTAGSTRAAAESDASDLARTGTSTLLVGGLALVLALTGAGALYVRRRKASL